MERSTPREGSICLPTGFDKWRLVLTLLALAAGSSAGCAAFLAFEDPAAAITVGVTTTDIALHLVGVMSSMSVLAHPAQKPAPVSGEVVSITEMVLALAVGASAGPAFLLAFGQPAEAVAVAVTAADIALHLVEMTASVSAARSVQAKSAPDDRAGDTGVAEPNSTAVSVLPAKDSLYQRMSAPVRTALGKLASRIRRFFDNFKGFGGNAAFAGAGA